MMMKIFPFGNELLADLVVVLCSVIDRCRSFVFTNNRVFIMAAFRLVHREQEGFKRERVLRDKLHPFDIYNDTELLARYRYTRPDLMAIIDSLSAEILFTVVSVGCPRPTIMVCRATRSGS